MSHSILVTGGCGFIGTNLVRHLLADGWHVRVLDNLSQGKREAADFAGVTLYERDVTEQGGLVALLEGINIVVHLAAYGSVIESMANPRENFGNNVVGTFNVLEAARQAGVSKVVFASTGGALIGDAAPPVDEDSVPRPISPYGASKLCGEAYLSAFGRAFGIETVSLRFANVYGPYSEHKKGAVNSFMKAIASDQPIVIYGDGSASRDFLYVDDLCRGIVRTVNTSLMPGSVYHLASGVETTIVDLARAVAVAAGKPGHPIEYLPRRAGEVDRNFARYDAANRALGYAPRWSLQDGLRMTWEWFNTLTVPAAVDTRARP